MKPPLTAVSKKKQVRLMRDKRPEKDRDQASHPWDRETQRLVWGLAVFFMESGIRNQFLRVKGSKFSSVLGSGIKILGKKYGISYK